MHKPLVLLGNKLQYETKRHKFATFFLSFHANLLGNDLNSEILYRWCEKSLKSSSYSISNYRQNRKVIKLRTKWHTQTIFVSQLRFQQIKWRNFWMNAFLGALWGLYRRWRSQEILMIPFKFTSPSGDRCTISNILDLKWNVGALR